jgi:hypothetical protein
MTESRVRVVNDGHTNRVFVDGVDMSSCLELLDAGTPFCGRSRVTLSAIVDVVTAVVIPADTDYADAVGMLLKPIGPGGPYWRYQSESTGLKTPAELRYKLDEDWMRAACELAQAAGFSLENRDGWLKLVDVAAEQAEAERVEDRRLELELAYRMGYPRVDDLLAVLSDSELAEWKQFLADRKD